ncbi:MAG: hypothetical protein JSU05_15240, partial [Bacteroidetes bacterium]|nr:hypothetical protein [Bacteroidota bacterium]
MKNNFSLFLVSVVLITQVFLWQSCIKDNCHQSRTYTWYTPVYSTKQQVRDGIKSSAATDLQNTGKIYIRGNYIFLNELNKGIHVIDNTDPSRPVNKAFIAIPGNIDLAVKGNTLYADMYTDLTTIDITDPLNIQLKKITPGVFPYRYWGGDFSADTSMIITSWVRHDTTVKQSCDESWLVYLRGGVLFMDNMSQSASNTAASPYGIGGSMAKFAVMNDYLYTVSTSALDIFNISNNADPVHKGSFTIGWSVETIYPYRGKLFIGSQAGVYMYDVANPENPSMISQVIYPINNWCVRDPVVADDNYMFETRRTQTVCDGTINKLYVMSVTNPASPVLLNSYDMKNPKGLSKDGDLLFVCDGDAGLRVFNTADINNLQQIKNIMGFETYDVIANNHIAIVVAKDGLYQYDYSTVSN